jgi:hypothetical protein
LISDLLSSGGNPWLPATFVEAPLRAGSRLVTPDEPSTIALAVVAAATMAIYLAARGFRTSRQNTVAADGKATRRPAATTLKSKQADVPRRGAA